jgi:hypothetical protein
MCNLSTHLSVVSKTVSSIEGCNIIQPTCYWNADTAVGIITRLRAGRFVVHILAGTRDISLLQVVQTASGAHPASYSAAGA